MTYFGSAGEFPSFSVVVCDMKSCMGDLLVWGSLRLAPITFMINKNYYTVNDKFHGIKLLWFL